MYLRELFLREDDRSTAVFAFGRFNPPTIGHEKLIQKVQSVANKVNGKGYVFLAHTGGTAKDPIDFTTKLSYMRQHFQPWFVFRCTDLIIFGIPLPCRRLRP